MTPFDLSLRQRFILAVVPGALMSLTFFLNDSDVDLGHALFLVYAALYGVLVMAPFINSRAMLPLRFTIIVISPILIAQATIAVTFTDFTIGLGDEIDFFALWLFPTMILALVLFIAAPLRISGRYWIYVALSGLLSAAIFFAWLECCLHIFSRSYPWWHDLFGLLPFVLSPISFSAAVYFGRVDVRQSAGGD